jgi:SAM-dependent methyltransferase
MPETTPAPQPLPALPALMRAQPHDVRARGDFVLALKSWAVRDCAKLVHAHYNEKIVPALERDGALSNTSAEDRQRVKHELSDELIFQLWSKLSYESQGMKWEFVDRIVHQHLETLQQAADDYLTREQPLGSLTLDPALELPANIHNNEIHRQPRGFTFEYHDRDISAGALYNMGALIGPAVAAGRGRLGRGRSAGDFLCELVRQRYPELDPRDVLEVGCGTGRNTPAYKRAFPEARVQAVDCAAGLLRWAFVSAESQGVAIDFSQMDITRMPFPDASFDLVASHIVGHETSKKHLPLMIAEAWRVLRPGGVMFHMDVPIQRGRIDLCAQVLNDFQVRHNGEPFWTGWIDADIPALMRAAGVPDACAFVSYDSPPERNSPWYCYGARKPL